MEDVINRVREHGELLAKGAPHQQGIGKDILKVAERADLHSAADAVNVSGLADELLATAGKHSQLQVKNEQLEQQVTDLSAIIAELTKKHDGVALMSTSHETAGTSIAEVVCKMQAGGIMGPNGGVLRDVDRYPGDVGGESTMGRSDAEARKDDDKPLSKAEKKARAKALQKELDTTGKVDGEPK